ncbi:Sterol 3-beta-glucosyltransferase ATG26 [Trichinella pseudospiralis]
MLVKIDMIHLIIGILFFLCFTILLLLCANKEAIPESQVPPAVEKLDASSPSKDESSPQSVTGQTTEQQHEQKPSTTNPTDEKSQEDSTLMVSFDHPN